MTTPANEWREDEIHRIIIGIGTGNIDYNQAKKDIQNLLTTVAQEAMEERDTYWKERVQKDNLMGMIVKNSTGFDTVGNQRLWHLDIDAFEADLDTLLDNLK